MKLVDLKEKTLMVLEHGAYVRNELRMYAFASHLFLKV